MQMLRETWKEALCDLLALVLLFVFLGLAVAIAVGLGAS
jgi:hypothetical protein